MAHPDPASSERDLSYLVGERVFSGDDPVGCALVRRGDLPTWKAGSADQHWLPRGVLRRLVFLGRAYSLHALGHIDMVHTTRLLAPLARSLQEELTFLGTVVSDPHLVDARRGLLPLLHACEQAAGEREFIVVPGKLDE